MLDGFSYHNNILQYPKRTYPASPFLCRCPITKQGGWWTWFYREIYRNILIWDPPVIEPWKKIEWHSGKKYKTIFGIEKYLMDFLFQNILDFWHWHRENHHPHSVANHRWARFILHVPKARTSAFASFSLQKIGLKPIVIYMMLKKCG